MKTIFLSLCLLLAIPAFPVIAEESIEMEFEELPDTVKKTVLERLSLEDIRKIEEILVNNYLKYKIESTKTVGPDEYIDIDLTVDSRGQVLHEDIFKTSGDLSPSLTDSDEPEETEDSEKTDLPTDPEPQQDQP
ncbi:MAG: hypothetical protein Q7U98_00075 [Methylicorpusculum sp.]|uniref:hypothetical protein n=1 Tax=Methylicorpusculum sp. TaxID=2713644 RepID=UPI0027188858|nr:hypothetical protein [Methylicorpusculum sp.]MDO8846418.1 hypothetical protein [Methylicorpusculum sp.]MDO8937535.1 hypothetical protein [Methylicorpusculum sp.]MDO9241591.1 hypothetical protein [Methylicorpusculum sp.]MDP2177610.1 hypothetical protein [Methylicorpusculum sp.]MDP2201354.1 hypothetical protein [Methylicorpusculum sp.]